MNTSKPLPPPASDPHDRQQDPTNQPSGEPKPAEKSKIDFSPTQVLGGALAAMTAAALGSRLGVAGTITGAALASVIAAIAGSLYTASLRHTREKVKTVFSGRAAPGSQTGAAGPALGSLAPKAGVPVSPAATAEVPAWDLPPAAARSPRREPSRGVSWKAVLAGAVAAFAIAAVALTGFELITGQALSGGQGTTIKQVSEEGKPATKASKKASPSESATPSASDSATPSESPSPAPEAAPSEGPSVTESPAPPSEAPTPQPSATASDTPSEPTEPSDSQAPSESSGDVMGPSAEATPAG